MKQRFILILYFLCIKYCLITTYSTSLTTTTTPYNLIKFSKKSLNKSVIYNLLNLSDYATTQPPTFIKCYHTTKSTISYNLTYVQSCINSCLTIIQVSL